MISFKQYIEEYKTGDKFMGSTLSARDAKHLNQKAAVLKKKNALPSKTYISRCYICDKDVQMGGEAKSCPNCGDPWT